MRIRVLVVAAMAVALSGCATMVDGTHQYITINSPPTYYTHCVLSRPGESWNVTTPGSIRIEKSADDLTLRCARPGYRDTVATIPSDVDLWTFGNVVTGVVTAGIDAATGAMYEYPEEFSVPMSPGMTAPAPVYSPTYAAPASAPDQVASPVPARAPASPGAKPLPGTLPDSF